MCEIDVHNAGCYLLLISVTKSCMMSHSHIASIRPFLDLLLGDILVLVSAHFKITYLLVALDIVYAVLSFLTVASQ